MKTNKVTDTISYGKKLKIVNTLINSCPRKSEDSSQQNLASKLIMQEVRSWPVSFFIKLANPSPNLTVLFLSCCFTLIMASAIQFLVFSLLVCSSWLCWSSSNFLLNILRSSSLTTPLSFLFNSYASANFLLHSLLAVSWEITGTESDHGGTYEIQQILLRIVLLRPLQLCWYPA